MIIRHIIFSRHIKKEVASLGGELIKISYRHFFTDIGPFRIVGKGRVIYKFTYREQNQIKEGWVRFGRVRGTLDEPFTDSFVEWKIDQTSVTRD